VRHAESPAVGPVAVVDIGSNSIRLVVYEQLSRSPAQLYNEKVLCSLGRTLEQTGRLNPEGVVQALDCLERFSRLIEAMKVARLDVVATAAIRDAADGREFLEAVGRRSGLQVRIISGEEEARLSGLGVLAGIPGACGAMGDLGGGSLELVGLDRGEIGRYVTLPFGPLRLMGLSLGRSELQDRIAKALDRIEWLSSGAQRNFYCVGGAWRALAKIHMNQVKHPLEIIHHYTVDGAEMTNFAGLISRQSRSSLERMVRISRKRLEALPYAALALERTLRRLRPSKVVFSAFGLREGILFDQLPKEARAKDPLLSACAEVAARSRRFGDPLALFHWITPLFAGENAEASRLRRATCLLTDFGWREHPDHRAEQVFHRVLQLPVAGVDHSGRAFLALALYARYGGDIGDPAAEVARRLLEDEQRRQAAALGAAMRLGHTLAGGAFGLLDSAALRLAGGRLTLELEPGVLALGGDVVQRRLDTLSKALGISTASIVPRSDAAA
jgi:exopolyphosphatase/guanosine-5'-triphosphate,3'-diphosphate pyrophosphatase